MGRWLTPVTDLFPLGIGDFVVQVIILLTTYMGYRIARVAARGAEEIAAANGRAIMDAEKALGMYVEPWVQTQASHVEPIIRFFNGFYINVHLPALIVCLLWVYLVHRPRFALFRDWFLAINLLGVIGYALVPTAPPRLLPSSGMVDTLFLMSDQNFQSGMVGAFANPYAAMPSLHIGYAVFVAAAAIMLARSRWAKAAVALYPLLMLIAITVTGNHWLLDAVAGAAVAGAAYWMANRSPALASAPQLMAARSDGR